ncbi:uncharacterized protein LOC123900143 [Trifolium pratense]|uniref:Uncharacterized protein n=1 Tax=Trifolium pratense TaxID=57577 RepID=A0ACB0IJ24_TRIPR|nr:uncharacterized protein LOC123900143 [Trifolium pratense]CAJ2631981.1 unnamed protein product [Trifolium pratense]
MAASNNSSSQYNDDDDDNEIDPDYAAFLAENGVDFYENYDLQNGNYEGSEEEVEIIDPTMSDGMSAITINNIPPCSDNVYYETFTTLVSGRQVPKSHVFEFSVGHLNFSTPTQITLPTALNDYVRRFNFHKLILGVPDQSSSEVHLKYPCTHLKNVKIVKGWKKFCSDNNIEFEDRVRFEFKEFGTNVCEVTKLM